MTIKQKIATLKATVIYAIRSGKYERKKSQDKNQITQYKHIVCVHCISNLRLKIFLLLL